MNDSYPEIQGILGCADSGVPPELIFDANFGQLFIIRVAGNVISPEVMGSIPYADSHLHTPLFLVLGHEGRGAKAALESKLNGAKHRSRIHTLVNNIAWLVLRDWHSHSSALPFLPDEEKVRPDTERINQHRDDVP